MDSTISAAIIAGGTAVAGSALTLLVSETFRSIRDKRAMKERLFNNLFPERIKAHQDIVRTVSELRPHDFAITQVVPDDLRDIADRIDKALLDLRGRYQTIASDKVLEVLEQLDLLARELPYIIESKLPEDKLAVLNEIGRSSHHLYFKLLETARNESGAEFIDEGLRLFANLFKNAAVNRINKPVEEKRTDK